MHLSIAQAGVIVLTSLAGIAKAGANADPAKFEVGKDTSCVRPGNVRCYRIAPPPPVEGPPPPVEGPPPLEAPTIAICNDKLKWVDKDVGCTFGCMEERMNDLEGKPVYRAACTDEQRKHSLGGSLGPQISYEDQSVLPGYAYGPLKDD